MNAQKLRKLKGSTLERATRIKALTQVDAGCKAVLKPLKFAKLRYSKLKQARMRYIYGTEDEAP